jgi:hypothetical protein
MADFPNYVYLRRPLEDAELVLGGGLNAAIDRLQEIREEVVAIETQLGTALKASSSSLAARLSQRLSKNGVPRGQLYFTPGQGIWYDGTLWLQLGRATISGPSTAFGFQAFTTNYLTADVPDMVITTARANSGTNPCAWAVAGRILATGFYYSLAQRGRAYNGSSTVVDDITFNWLAIGGTPA